MHKKIKLILEIERFFEKSYSFFDFVGIRLKNLFFGHVGIRLTYRRETVIALLFLNAILIAATDIKWLVSLGISSMMLTIFLWLIIIFAWTVDPLIDYKIRIHKIKRWGEKLLKYLSGEFKNVKARDHMEVYAWGKLASFEELKNEVMGFSKTNLLQKFLGRFFSTFIILILGYAFIYFGLYKINNSSFVSAAQQQGLASFGSILDFIYYSGITVTTVGYGDIYPILPLVRVLVLTEVLCGALLVIFLISSFTAISIHLTAERQQALINEIEKEIKDIDKIFSELKQIYKEER